MKKRERQGRKILFDKGAKRRGKHNLNFKDHEIFSFFCPTAKYIQHSEGQQCHVIAWNCLRAASHLVLELERLTLQTSVVSPPLYVGCQTSQKDRLCVF